LERGQPLTIVGSGLRERGVFDARAADIEAEGFRTTFEEAEGDIVMSRIELARKALTEANPSQVPLDVAKAATQLQSWLFEGALHGDKAVIDAGKVIRKWVEEDPDA
jgi:hypothetical protein